ncbi:helicase domain protein [Nitzschia inconspicua]|uniref:Helicase domain protein n=1 Tax=Nitzschia inconspicua TaxID=303405 RepID=A0A9K3KA16_9STRA|nr:helicase domain protein [Nitzschia inconspicua]KAG7339979.1 helicase domain protein [Nitzschia inconspicua]
MNPEMLLVENLDELWNALQATQEDVQYEQSFFSEQGRPKQEASMAVDGFPTSMVPFPDPIGNDDEQRVPEQPPKPSSLPPFSSAFTPDLFPKPLGRPSMTRKITPVDLYAPPMMALSSSSWTNKNMEANSVFTSSYPFFCSHSRSLSLGESVSSDIFDDHDDANQIQVVEQNYSTEDLFDDELNEDVAQRQVFFGKGLDSYATSPSLSMPAASAPIPAICISDQGTTPASSSLIPSSAMSAASAQPRPQRYQSQPWNERLEELKQFHEEHGHMLVPHVYGKNPRLSQWVKRQRYQYRLKKLGRHSTLSDQREAVLQKIGFVWESHKQSWDDSFRSLQIFYATHGHVRVTKSNADDTLNTWCKHQRRQYKRFVCGQSSHMTAERIRKLESVQFDWDPRNMLGTRTRVP